MCMSMQKLCIGTRDCKRLFISGLLAIKLPLINNLKWHKITSEKCKVNIQFLISSQQSY